MDVCRSKLIRRPINQCQRNLCSLPFLVPQGVFQSMVVSGLQAPTLPQRADAVART